MNRARLLLAVLGAAGLSIAAAPVASAQNVQTAQTTRTAAAGLAAATTEDPALDQGSASAVHVGPSSFSLGAYHGENVIADTGWGH
jgi:hypothetical protein